MATRSDIRTRARIRADQDKGTFPDDTQYNLLIDEAGQDTWWDLVRAGWPLDFTSVSVSANGSQVVSTGITDCAFVRGVFRQDGTQYTELHRIPEAQRAGLMAATSANQADFYDLRFGTSGLKLELLPVVSSGTYIVQYVKQWPGFSGDSDVWVGLPRTDELVVLRAAAKGARKEQNTDLAAQLDRERAELFEAVQAMAPWLDMRNPPLIRDVRESPRDPFAYQVDGRGLQWD